MVIRIQSVNPLVDIQTDAFAHDYELGLWWRMYGEEQGQGPLPDSYLIDNLKTCAKHDYFDGQHDHRLHHVGFFIGMLHGGILLPCTGTLRSNVTTLVVITHHEFARGYNVGRRWYFFDALPDEDRHYTEVRVMQDLRDLVADIPEEFAEGADDKCIQYVVGTLLGAISARLFSATEDEYRQWEADRQYWLALSHSERVTKPLVQLVPQHV